MIGDIQINDRVLTANSYRKITEGFIDFEVSDRTIDNTLVSDFLATKKTFVVEWRDCAIDGELLNELIALSQSSDDVTFIKTNYDLTTTTTICRLKLSDSFKRIYEKEKYAYEDVKVSLEEV